MEVIFDLGPLTSIGIRNLFVMPKLGKLDLQINIKRVKGEILRSFLENHGSGLTRPSFKKY